MEAASVVRETGKTLRTSWVARRGRRAFTLNTAATHQYCLGLLVGALSGKHEVLNSQTWCRTEEEKFSTMAKELLLSKMRQQAI